jgi:plasmid maintenance system killer protein
MAAFNALPPGADFKALHGRLRGTYQLRIAGPYRVRFRWAENRSYDIEARNFHDEH